MGGAKPFNVKVAVRVRPLLGHDRSQKAVVHATKGAKPSVTVVDPDKAFPGKKQEIDYLRADYIRERSYEFDHVYGPENTTAGVFEEAVAPLIANVLEGFNVTVFAYGQTGSGKTHTMLGHGKEAGVVPLALGALFGSAKPQSVIKTSFVELYNEEIRDLLAEGPARALQDHGGQGGLDLREDPVRGSVIAGVTEVAASDVAGVMALLTKGNARRTQEPTRANAESSRSHAVLQIAIESSESSKKKDKVVKIKLNSKLSLIDLAGSERAAETRNVGARLQEGARINRSLLALGNVINALRKAHDSKHHRKGECYVNFRDSKLTRLLKDSLGGNCRTLMLAHVSPSAASFEETLNTLKYANRARAIKNAVKENLKKIEKPRRVLRPAAVHPEPAAALKPSPSAPRLARPEEPRRKRRRPSKAQRPSDDRPMTFSLSKKSLADEQGHELRQQQIRERFRRQRSSRVAGGERRASAHNIRAKLRARRASRQAGAVHPLKELRVEDGEAGVAQLHKTRRGVVGQVRLAVELRKTVEAMTAGRAGGEELFRPRKSPGAPAVFPPIRPEEKRAVAAAAAAYAAAAGLGATSTDLLHRDPLAFLSNVLLQGGGTKASAEPAAAATTAPPPPDAEAGESPAGVEATPSGDATPPPAPGPPADAATATRVRARAARECEGLRRAVKRGLDKQQHLEKQAKTAKRHEWNGSTLSPDAEKKLLASGPPAASPAKAAADAALTATQLLDAEMRIVGAELEKLEIAEAAVARPETQTDEREVHAAALEKLEHQVRLRNDVIRKLVAELEKRKAAARRFDDRGRLANQLTPGLMERRHVAARRSNPNMRALRVDAQRSPLKNLAQRPDGSVSPRPASAVETPRRVNGEASTIFAELLGTPTFLDHLPKKQSHSHSELPRVPHRPLGPNVAGNRTRRR